MSTARLVHLASLLVLCTSVHAQGSTKASGVAPLRVMTFNIRLQLAQDGDNDWPHRRDLAVEAIEESGCVAVGLQEVLPGQRRDLLEALPHFEPVDGFERRDYLGNISPIIVDERRLAVEEQGAFWLSTRPELVYSKGWDARWPRICTWAVLRDRLTDLRFALINTHLDNHGQTARLEGAKLMIKRAAELRPLPIVVTGDLNAHLESPPLLELFASGLRDTFRDVHPDESRIRTAHRFRGGGDGPQKIDHVLCDAQWTVSAAHIDRRERDGRYPSDHYPVWAELRPARAPEPKPRDGRKRD